MGFRRLAEELRTGRLLGLASEPCGTCGCRVCTDTSVPAGRRPGGDLCSTCAVPKAPTASDPTRCPECTTPIQLPLDKLLLLSTACLECTDPPALVALVLCKGSPGSVPHSVRVRLQFAPLHAHSLSGHCPRCGHKELWIPYSVGIREGVLMGHQRHDHHEAFCARCGSATRIPRPLVEAIGLARLEYILVRQFRAAVRTDLGDQGHGLLAAALEGRPPPAVEANLRRWQSEASAVGDRLHNARLIEANLDKGRPVSKEWRDLLRPPSIEECLVMHLGFALWQWLGPSESPRSLSNPWHTKEGLETFGKIIEIWFGAPPQILNTYRYKIQLPHWGAFHPIVGGTRGSSRKK